MIRVRAVQAVVAAAILTVWQVVAVSTGGYFVPEIGSTVGRLANLVVTGEVWGPLAATNESLILGFPLGLLGGLTVGFAFGRIKLLDRAYGYVLDMGMVVPMVAIVPVVIVALGLGTAARVVVVCLFTAPAVAISARAAVRVLANDLLEMSRAFGASRSQLWSTVILPSSVPMVANGTKIGLSQAVSGMVAVELILIPVGVGGGIIEAKAAFDAATVFALTAVLVVEGVLLVSVVTWVQRRIMHALYGEEE